MAASAGTVTLDLDANSVKLLRELQKAERSTKRTASNMGADFAKMAANIAKTTAVVATAFAAMTTKLTRDGLKVIDANAKMARALGASNDALQALQMAAGDVGLQGLDSSLNRMNRRLGAAEFGAGAAAKTVEILGLDLAALAQMDIDEKLQSISKSIKDAGLSSEQAARHLQNLGFEQAQATAFFSTGISDLSGYRKEINALGLSLSDIDAQKIEEANDAMGVFGDLIQGLGRQLAITASTTLTIISNHMLKVAMETEKMGFASTSFEEKFRFAIASVLEKTGQLIGFFESRSEMAQFGLIGFVLFGKKGALIGGAIGAIFAEIEQKMRTLGMLGVDENAANLARIAERIIDTEKAINSARERQGQGQNQNRQLSNLTAQLELLNKEAADLKLNMSAEGWTDFNRYFSEAEQDVFSLSGAVQNLADKLRQGQQDFVGPQEREFTGLPDIEEVLEDEFKPVKEFMEKTESELNQFAQQAAANMQTSFANFLFDPFKEGLRGMLSGLIDTLRRMVAEIAAQKVLGAIFSGLANAANPFIASVGAAFGGSAFVGPMPSRDSGGRGVAGQPYMIGKGAQPEVFIPDSAGAFIPNADQMGGSTFNITIDAKDAGAEARIRDMINNEMAPQIIAAAKGSTIASLKRPRFA